MTELTIPHAIEKVTFRLGLTLGGYVPIARIFVEFPLSLELIDEQLAEIADGRSLLRDEAGEFCAIHLPEFEAVSASLPERLNCPTCDGPGAPAMTDGGEVVAQPIICATCYRNLARLAIPERSSTFSKLRSFFVEDEDDPVARTRMEHEIFFKGLVLGGRELTHTALAAQTPYPLAQVKDCLQFMGARRYLRFGLTSGGDAVAYTFPDELVYARPQYQRFKDAMDLISTLDKGRPSASKSSPSGRLDLGLRREPRATTLTDSRSARGVSFNGRISAKPRGDRAQPESNLSAASRVRPPASASTSSSFRIVVKNRDEGEAPASAPPPAPSSGLRISVKRSGSGRLDPPAAEDPPSPREELAAEVHWPRPEDTIPLEDELIDEAPAAPEQPRSASPMSDERLDASLGSDEVDGQGFEDDDRGFSAGDFIGTPID